MKNSQITPIIESEVNKYADRYRLRGFSEIESLRFTLREIEKLKLQEPLIAIYWETEKALVIKIENYESRNNRR